MECSKCYTFLYDFLEFSFNQPFIKRNSIKNNQIKKVIPSLIKEIQHFMSFVLCFQNYTPPTIVISFIDSISLIIETSGIITKKNHIEQWAEYCIEGIMRNLESIHQEHSLQKPCSSTGPCFGIKKVKTIYDDLYD